MVQIMVTIFNPEIFPETTTHTHTISTQEEKKTPILASTETGGHKHEPGSTSSTKDQWRN